MNTTFVINGGAGRVVCAIPALEKFHQLNPEDDFKVLVYGWESLYWSHPILQNRTFSISQKGVFEQYIKNSRLVTPEPYCMPGYYTQQQSLAEAFDAEINHSTLASTKPNLYLQQQEILSARQILAEQLKAQNKSKIVVFQPYGSGAKPMPEAPFDSTHRSLYPNDYLKITQALSRDALVVYFGEKQFIHPGDTVSFKPAETINADIRFWMACISQADYFIGCDSLGQHIARAFDIPGLIMLGSTFGKNVSYPEYFHIYRNGKLPTYSPIRISPTDCEFADRSNDGIMEFNLQQLNQICQQVNKDLKK